MAANMHKTTPTARTVASRHLSPPDLEPILADTYGLMIYQESVMRWPRNSPATRWPRRTISKGLRQEDQGMIQAEREKFVAGCVTEGYEEILGTQLFEHHRALRRLRLKQVPLLRLWAGGVPDAWLKAHYPVEYLAALLTSVKDDKDKTAVYLGECRSLGIEVLVPDVNTSAAEFTLWWATTASGASCSDWPPCATLVRAWFERMWRA